VSRFPSSRRRSSAEPSRLAPSEGGFVIVAGALVLLSSWGLSGRADWAQPWLHALALLALALPIARQREGERVGWWPFAPLVLWIAFCGVALLNPSHSPAPSGGWIPRPDWIRWLPTTVDHDHTISDLRYWLFPLALGGAACALVRGASGARALWSAIALNGLALALVGAWFRLSGADLALGFIEPPESTYFFATFFYKNHWAAFGALSATAGLALALEAWPGVLAGDPRARGRACLYGAAGVLTLVTLPLPGSRSGALFALALLGAFLATGLVLWWRQRTSGTRNWIPLIPLGAMALIVGFGAAAYAPTALRDFERTRTQLERPLEGGAFELRTLVTRDTWRMAAARPWFGWGPGAYEIVFPLFHGNYLRGPDGRVTDRFDMAHNDWLHTLAETGWLGTLMLVGPIVALAVRSWRRASLAGRWGLGGCGLVALHAWIDFPLRNAAVVLVWALLLATAGRLAAKPADDTTD
jgi:O-antigen ligase